MHAPCEVRQDVLGQVVERRELVDQLSGLDPPGGLEAEPDRPDHASYPAEDEPDQVEQASDHGPGRGMPPRARGAPWSRSRPATGSRIRLTEDHPPEDEGGVEGEDRERDPGDRVAAETPLLGRETLPPTELVPEVVLDELERARAQVGDLDQVREDPVPVELQQRDQVQEDHEVVEERELVEQIRQRPIREGEEREAGDTRRSRAR